MMKRILVSAIIAAASINAYAESNVTLYGVIDQAVAVTKHKHEAAKVRIDDGIYAGSRFGIKGTEDLGNGNSVGFILEQGFYADSGDAAETTSSSSRTAKIKSCTRRTAANPRQDLPFTARVLNLRSAALSKPAANSPTVNWVPSARPNSASAKPDGK